MMILKTTVAREVKARFRSVATARGMSESELLRAVILIVIGETDGDDHPVKPDAKKLDIARMTVRMPQFLMEAAKERAKSNGMAPSRWVTALVQSNLTRLPVMTSAELTELQKNTRELAAIGRNLNQIARAMNDAFMSRTMGEVLDQADQVQLDSLASLRLAIAENQEAIRALVRASYNVWEAET